VIAVYTGSCGNLTCIEQNFGGLDADSDIISGNDAADDGRGNLRRLEDAAPDEPPPEEQQSNNEVFFESKNGTSYYLFVGGYLSESVSYDLNLEVSNQYEERYIARMSLLPSYCLMRTMLFF